MEMDDVDFCAKQIEEANTLSIDDIKYLKEFRVKLLNPVLPQHEIESRAGSRPPTRKEIEKFQKIEHLKKGCYHPSEDMIIAKNWKSFCKLHEWKRQNVGPFIRLRVGNQTHIRSKRERRKFVQFLADGLPNRTLYSVYHRFRNLYEPRVQRRFLPQEDKMIIDHLENNENLDAKRKYAELAKVLRRTRASIWRRYKLLKKKRQIKKSLC